MSFGIRLSIIAIVLCSFASVNAQHSPTEITAAQMTSEKWREDLRFMGERLPATHKNLYHKLSKADFEAAVRKLDKRIPTLADHEIVVEMMRIIAMIGDGHTGAHSAPFLFSKGAYPVRFHMFDDGLHIRAAAAEHASINGGKVLKISSVTADEAMKRVAGIVWHDNEMGIKDIGPRLLSSPQVQHALGIAGSAEKTTLTVLKDGKEVTAELRPTATVADLRLGATSFLDSRRAAVDEPLWLKNPSENFWFEYQPETKILFVQFNAVQNKQNETIEAFFNKVFDYAEKHPVEKLVLDLRMNGGGNNTLNLPLTLRAVRSRLNEPGKFFVLIGRETFSAAQNTVNELEKYTSAVFVGEPTGASPNHYGDAGRFTLPNSKLVVQASTLWWQDADPRDTRKWKAPDVAAELTSEAYRAGRDPAMDAILNYKPAMSLNAIMAEARSKPDIKLFVERMRTFKSNPAHKYADAETPINNAGYFLLGRNQVDDAIQVFQLNVELHPRSANAHDSLGEAFLRKGDKGNALTSYKKALEIDPTFRTAVEAVRTLTK